MSQWAEINFAHSRNVDFRQEVVWEGVDFSGSTFEMDIKTEAGAGAPALSATIDDTDAAAGTLVIVWPDNALPTGSYVYDLVRIDSGERSLLALGTIVIFEGVTQP